MYISSLRGRVMYMEVDRQAFPRRAQVGGRAVAGRTGGAVWRQNARRSVVVIGCHTVEDVREGISLTIMCIAMASARPWERHRSRRSALHTADEYELFHGGFSVRHGLQPQS